MERPELKRRAREALQGKWGKAILLMLMYLIIVGLIEVVAMYIPVIGPIASLVVSVPLSVGYIACFMKLVRGEEFGNFDFFKEGFDRFGKAWGVVGHTALKMIVPIIVYMIAVFGVTFAAVYSALVGSAAAAFFAVVFGIAVIPAVIWFVSVALLYSLTTYILVDNPDMSSKEIVEESAKLMKGNRVKIFVLGLSFIGWAILAGFTCGIGYIWLLPYIAATEIFFYEALVGRKTSVVKEEKAEEAEEVEVEEPVTEQNNPIDEK